MLRTLSVLLLVFVTMSSAARGEKPWFCHGLDCPDYEVTKTTPDYEVRDYAAGKWASTNIEGYGYDKAVKTAFWKLFKYIGGANEQKQKISMTAPVRVMVNPSQGPYCKSSFKVSFYIPDKFQGEPPAPSADDVFVEECRAMRAYVASYGGWNNEDKVVKRAAALFEVLQKEGVNVNDSAYYTAGYDSPFRLMNRHNEIWLLEGDESASQDMANASHAGHSGEDRIRQQA